ncbi:MAG: flippase-like domain-containing protein [Bacteroidetes bacterium]|nr:flippase-like domain-containing protein [Bacteroidota bacterium]
MKNYLRFIGLIVLLVILLKIDVGELLKIVYRVNIIYLLIAIILFIPLTYIKSYRWKKLLSIQNIDYSLTQSFFVYMSSLYIGFVTPGRLGEFAKVLYLKSDKGISLSKGMSSVLIDRLFDLYLLIILGLIGIWKFDILGKWSNTSLLLLLIFISSPLLILNKQLVGKVVGLIYKSVIKTKAQLRDKMEERFEDFYNGIHQLLTFKLLFSVVLTCLSYLVFFIQCYLIVMAMGLSINFITIMLFMAVSNLISFIPISISGLGTRDAALIYLFSLIGLKPELAVSYAFLVFITFFVCGGLMGAVAWWIKPLDIKSNK